MPQDRTLTNLQRRLERWELNHLRALAAQQEERIGLLETELEIAQEHAEFWHDQARNMVEELQADGKTVGITQSGALVLVPQDAPADDLMTERRGCMIQERGGKYHVYRTTTERPVFLGTRGTPETLRAFVRRVTTTN